MVGVNFIFLMIRELEEVRFFFLYLTGKGECPSTKSNLLMRLIRNAGIDSLLGSEVGSEDFFQGWGGVLGGCLHSRIALNCQKTRNPSVPRILNFS